MLFRSLDEPTNHLDHEMRDSLLLALQEFAGAVVLVSHDRGLLGGVCDEFLLVRDGRVEAFDGDLADYARWLAQRDAAPRPTEAMGDEDRRGRRRAEAERRNKLAPLRAALRDIEAQLARLGAERADIEATLVDPAFYGRDDAAQRDLPRRHGELLAQIAALEERWLETGEQLEAAEKGP